MIVVAHGQCVDGFTSAWIAWLKYKDAAEYVFAKYGDPPPDVTGQDILIVDFSYPRKQILDLVYPQGNRVTILDHHRTAEADLAIEGPIKEAVDAGRLRIVFDMNRSGAGITWDELHGGPRPALVDYVEDRDLWRWAQPFSKEINAVIGSTEQTFHGWDELMHQIWGHFELQVSTGKALLRQVDRYVGEMSKQARTIHFEGHSVPVVNAPYINTSELVGHLAESATFAVGWYQRGDGMYAYSLRSRGDFDVSAIAKKYGGGGHRNSAGFSSAERIV